MYVYRNPLDLIANEPSTFISGLDKKAQKAAMAAERKYKKEMGIPDCSIGSRMKAFFRHKK
ncbi:MAG TPA: hypothetical protein VHO71_03850 [Caproiciproducens sp.]|nr:hypothetical protein [Caproiciproducens sp.]